MADFNAGDRVLVTGATGFIGAAAARALLALGAEVHGTSAAGRAGPADVVMHRCDLLDDAATAALLGRLRPTHLLHAAWDVTHGAYWTSPANLDWLAATARLLRGFAAGGGRRAVGVGSCAEYAWDGVALKANLSNISDKLYADGLYRGHYIPGKPRTLQVTATYKF